MTPLRLDEAELLIDEHLSGYAKVEAGAVEGTIFDRDIGETWDAIEAFVSTLDRQIDRSTIEVRPDCVEGMDVACVAIRIRTGG